MRKGKFIFEYVVVDDAGKQSPRYEIECKYSNSLGVATCAAEAYDGLPDSAGAIWPLTFIVFHKDGREYCRYQIKRWLVPHFMITRGTGADLSRSYRS